MHITRTESDNMIYNSKKEAITAIHDYASFIDELTAKTGIDIDADADDNSGLDVYLEARYKHNGHVKTVRVKRNEIDSIYMST